MSMYDAAEKAINDWAYERLGIMERRYGDCSVPLAGLLTLATVVVMLLAGRQ